VPFNKPQVNALHSFQVTNFASSQCQYIWPYLTLKCMCTMIKHVSEAINSLLLSPICPLISHKSIPFTIFKLTWSHIPSIYPMFHFEAKVQPNISKTETLIDLISSRQHLSEVFKLVSLPYSRNWDCFGGYMTPNMFCMLLCVHYITWLFSFWILTFLWIGTSV
jgi:hypothetical protein